MYDKYISVLTNLIKSVILDTNPEPLPDGIELAELAEFAKLHWVENIVYYALKKLDMPDSDIMKELEERANHAIINDATQAYYLELVTDEFEKNKIRHCVMKGPVIKPLYPSPDYRRSGDIDVFVDAENSLRAKEIMESLGFKTQRFDLSLEDDAYSIDKTIEIELHRTLVSNKVPWQSECQKITDRLVKSEGYEYRYEMTKEDYYLYMIAHFAKHMKYSGAGIKMVLDVWVYLNAYGDVLNWDILNQRLAACGLLEFENNCKKVSGYLFDNEEVDDIIKTMAKYIGNSGVFGTGEQLLAGELAKNAGGTNNKALGKVMYYLKLFFLPYKQMRSRYPILKKLPVLLPFMWVYRALNTVLFNKEKSDIIKNKYEGIDMDYGKQLLEFKEQIGL